MPTAAKHFEVVVGLDLPSARPRAAGADPPFVGIVLDTSGRRSHDYQRHAVESRRPVSGQDQDVMFGAAVSTSSGLAGVLRIGLSCAERHHTTRLR